MKKVFILFTGLFDLGGIQRYNRYLCDALEAESSNDDFIVISLNDLGKFEFKHWRNVRIKFPRLRKPKFIKKILFIFKVMLSFFIEKPNFLICGHIDLSPIALFLKKLFRLNYAVLTHGVDVWNLGRGIKYRGLHNADLVITVSRYTKEKMIANGISENRTKLLQDTVDTSVFYPKTVNQNLWKELALDNRRILLTVGRIDSRERYKGHDIMLTVLHELGNEYVWLIVGAGDDVPRLQQKAKVMGLISRIRFIGPIENNRLVDYYNLCDVFVMPSKGEGFGIVFLEAMACGKPVVGGNRDGSTEPLMNAELGFLVDPDNVKEIKQAIKLACSSKENRADPEYLRRRVEENFGTHVFNKKVKSIFEKFL